jgi:hypothetical protein
MAWRQRIYNVTRQELSDGEYEYANATFEEIRAKEPSWNPTDVIVGGGGYVGCKYRVISGPDTHRIINKTRNLGADYTYEAVLKEQGAQHSEGDEVIDETPHLAYNVTRKEWCKSKLNFMFSPGKKAALHAELLQMEPSWSSTDIIYILANCTSGGGVSLLGKEQFFISHAFNRG